MLASLLRDLCALPSCRDARVVVTLNIKDEPFDASTFAPLSIDVIRNTVPKGFGANHNAAHARVTDDCTWFGILNPDLRLPEDPFSALLDAARDRLDVAMIAPRIIGSSGRPEDAVRGNLTLPSLIRRSLGHRVAEQAHGPSVSRHPFYWLAGMFMLVKSKTFAEVGGFDERLFMYCEDYDLCARLYTAGHGILSVGNAFAIHDAQRDSHRSFKHLSWHVQSLLRVWCSAPFWSIVLEQRSRRRLE